MSKYLGRIFVFATVLLVTARYSAAQSIIIDPSIDLAKNGSSLGLLISGANLTSSSANTLGGPGHFSVGVSGTLSHPSFKGIQGGGSASSGSMAGILRLGVMEGTSLGPSVHGIGSVDLYLRLGKLYTNGYKSSDTGFWGMGTRIGILRNSILTPAVSLCMGYSRTGKFNLSEVIYGTHPGSGKTNISTWSIRCDVSKNFFFLTPMAGIGVNRNRIKGDSIVEDINNLNPDKIYIAPEGFKTSGSDLVYYAGVEWNIFLLRLGLELGRTGGETFGGLQLRLAI
jgi:hypothetical protein